MPPKDIIKFRPYVGDYIKHDALFDVDAYGPTFLTIWIYNVTNSSALVNITLEFRNATLGRSKPIKSLTLSRTLLLNLTDGYYYINGTRIGMPSFFVSTSNLPPKEKIFLDCKPLRERAFTCNDLKVSNVSFESKKTVITFVKKFYPPQVKVSLGTLSLTTTKHGDLALTGISWVIYDFDTGLAVSLDTVLSPEFIALGIICPNTYNYYSAKMNKKLDFSKEYWPYGFVLYKTNIQFPKEQTGKAPDTPLKYYLILGLVILTASLLRRWKK